MKTAPAMTLAYLVILSLMVGGLLLTPIATASTIEAVVNFDPDKMNLMAGPDGASPVVLAKIRLPKPYMKSVDQINASTILLEGFIPPLWCDVTKTVCEAFFDRQVVVDHLWLKTAHMGYSPPFKNEEVEMEVTGNLYDLTPFKGSDIILVTAK